jgi:leucyl/phenylalanyl-tRNA--protein transferase
MKRAYGVLHRCGFAHSVEVWHQSTLVGGLYGVAIGGVFFGESMFNRKSNASKVALVALCERLCGWSFRVIDCQMYTEHLARMGAEQVPRQQFLDLLADGLRSPHHGGHWSLDGCISGSIPCTD